MVYMGDLIGNYCNESRIRTHTCCHSKANNLTIRLPTILTITLPKLPDIFSSYTPTWLCDSLRIINCR